MAPKKDTTWRRCLDVGYLRLYLLEAQPDCTAFGEKKHMSRTIREPLAFVVYYVSIFVSHDNDFYYVWKFGL